MPNGAPVKPDLVPYRGECLLYRAEVMQLRGNWDRAAQDAHDACGLLRRDLSTYTMMTGIAVLVLFVTLGLFGVDDGAPLHPWAGLVQRILCAIWFACLIVLARHLRALCKSAAVGTTTLTS